MKMRVITVFILLWMAQLLCAQSEQVLLQDLVTARKDHKLITQTTILIKLAEFATQQHRTQSAIAYYSDAYSVSMQRKHLGDQMFVASKLADVYDKSGVLDKALQWDLIALKAAKAAKDRNREAMIHNNLGILYLNIGSYDQSLDHYIKALEIKKLNGDKVGIANALLNMAVYYIRTENYQTALEYQMQALDIRIALNDRGMIAANYNSIAVTYRHLGNYQSALIYQNKALDIYKRLKNTAKIASCYNNLGVHYLFLKDLHKAKEYYLKSYDLKKGSTDAYSILSSLNNLADISLKLHQTSEAKLYLDKANPYLETNQYQELSKSLNKLWSEYYESRGDTRQALAYFKTYHTVNDSLFNIQKQQQLNELEVKYEVLQKEQHIELLTRNNELSKRNLTKSRQLRNYLIIILVLICIIVLVIIWRFREVIRLNKRISRHQEELKLLNQGLEMRVISEVAIRQEQEQKAFRQSRLAILGELAAGIAHELNQPLQTLSLTIENILFALQDEPTGADVMEKKMNYLFEDINRMQSVIEHIRRFSKQSGDLSQDTFALHESISNAIDLVKDRFEHYHISVAYEHPECSPDIFGNQYKFEHVIINLLTNAKDAILEQREHDAEGGNSIQIRTQVTASNISISVHDEGCGIAPENLEIVFDSFFSTKPIDKGTGLGLAIVKSIIGNMNGTIQIDSKAGHGTTVTMVLPFIHDNIL